MQGTYSFYFIDGKLRCFVRDYNGKHIYSGERAYSLFKKINKEQLSSIKVNEKKKDDKKSLFFRLKGDSCTIIIKNLEQFYKNNLFDELSNHEKKFEKAIDKYEKKRKKQNNKVARNIVISSVVAAMIAASGASFIINKDKSNAISDTSKKATITLQEDKKVEDTSVNDKTNANADTDTKSKDEVKDLVEEPDVKYKFKDKTNTDTFKYVDDKYSDTIDKIASKRGISPNLLKAMITQESAGEDANLMQIQFFSFEDMELPAYDYEKNEESKICLTEDSSRHPDCRCIDSQELLDTEVNIDVGAIILQYYAKMFDHNIPLSVQAYNFGPGNVNFVIDEMSSDTGISVDDIINDKDSIEFTNYTNLISVGDPNYINNVMRYVDNRDDGIHIFSNDGKGNIDDNSFSLIEKQKSKKL